MNYHKQWGVLLIVTEGREKLRLRRVKKKGEKGAHKNPVREGPRLRAIGTSKITYRGRFHLPPQEGKVGRLAR